MPLTDHGERVYMRALLDYYQRIEHAAIEVLDSAIERPTRAVDDMWDEGPLRALAEAVFPESPPAAGSLHNARAWLRAQIKRHRELGFSE